MSKKLFEKYYARIAKEGWLKAALCGLIVGFSALLISSAIFWLIGFDYSWVGFILMGVALIAATPIFYYQKFRPTIKQIAKRVDELGLEERLLTMHQLENDDSYIAMRQREDAQAALKTVNASLLKVRVSVPLVVALCLVVPFSAAMSVVSVLSSTGKIVSGKEIIEDQLTPDPVFYEIEFVEDGGGMISGDLLYMVEEGKPIPEVTAEPDDGWYLAEWRWDIDGEQHVLENTDVFYVEGMVADRPLVITAVFAEAELGESEGEGEGGEGEGGAGEEGEGDPEGEPQESKGGGESEGENEDETPPDGEPSDSETPPDASINRYEEKNQIENNETYYGDEYEGAVEDAVGEMEQSEEIPEDVKDIIKDYFENIEK